MSNRIYTFGGLDGLICGIDFGIIAVALPYMRAFELYSDKQIGWIVGGNEGELSGDRPRKVRLKRSIISILFAVIAQTAENENSMRKILELILLRLKEV